MEFENFSIAIDNKHLINNFNGQFRNGETSVIIGPNGCGKSTFAHGIMGRPDIKVSGKLRLNDQDLLELETFERARAGVFVSWQTPPEISGVTSFGLIRDVKKITGKQMATELKAFKDLIKEVNLPSDWPNRQVNVGGSGGERKRAELVNLRSLDPRIAILDEIDTGLDTNGLKLVSDIINTRRDNGRINLVITHNKNLLEHMEYDNCYVFSSGALKEISKDELVRILAHGYDN
jgi:Fe-S cluster assembly ATP-binding protein|tara:strand:- start:1310 stop:2011 length:702 start_codon:yes stop_codon:yes gene_type:complete